jgi:hypothetical protein
LIAAVLTGKNCLGFSHRFARGLSKELVAL